MEAVAILVPIICSLGLFALIATIFVSSDSVQKARARAEAEMRARILERASAASDPPDPSVFRALVDAESRLLARDQILRGVRWSAVLLFLGGAFCILSRTEDSDALIPGLLLLAAGVGFVASTLIQLWLGRKWNVLNTQGEERA